MPHTYYVFSTGTNFKPVTKSRRLLAEIEMHKYCKKHNITGLECTECDTHERNYSTHKGVRFYINRI